MKIAVTGASGNLGSRVTRIAIAHGHKVVGIDKMSPATPPPIPDGASDEDEWFQFVELDVRDYVQVLEALRGCDAVIHLAAIPNPGDYVVTTHNLNVVASWNVLRASAELGIQRISQASSINAVGMVWGDNPLIDYLPMDEKHPCRPEDPYSLSKLVAEMQADTIIRRWPNMRIASFRLSWAVPNREYAMGREMDWVRKELWSWVDAEESARSFLLGVTSEIPEFKGHEAFFTVAPSTCQDELTHDLVAQEWPNVELRKAFTGREALYDCSKAERLLGWVHHNRSSSAPDAPEVEIYPQIQPATVPTAVELSAEPESESAPEAEPAPPATVLESEAVPAAAEQQEVVAEPTSESHVEATTLVDSVPAASETSLDAAPEVVTEAEPTVVAETEPVVVAKQVAEDVAESSTHAEAEVVPADDVATVDADVAETVVEAVHIQEDVVASTSAEHSLEPPVAPAPVSTEDASESSSQDSLEAVPSSPSDDYASSTQDSIESSPEPADISSPELEPTVLVIAPEVAIAPFSAPQETLITVGAVLAEEIVAKEPLTEPHASASQLVEPSH